jgi:DNA-binding transcriptional regulator YdaS (Cro superfamily)
MQVLKKYLKKRNKREFAESVGIVPAYLSQIQAGIKRPSFDLMVRIEVATGGDVPLSSWVRSAAE